MEELDIKIVESERDLEELHYLGKLCGKGESLLVRSNGRHSAIARIDTVPIGFWDGGVADVDALSDSFNVKYPCFSSDYIFVRGDGLFRNRGFGFKMQKHQFKEAKKLGFKSFCCWVQDGDGGFKIQKKFGARMKENTGLGVLECYYDLDELKF